eukprot:TRINITY_DN16043_c0_g1_i1.p1 TRINITY_DN16043_c0_g1~~TRINITY_DN16043_c0_g1_i1.p1  ORF type:complete len:664 (-),score=105.68 TRINITY_DN16043_c0_g1_i1:417-2408(-)
MKLFLVLELVCLIQYSFAVVDPANKKALLNPNDILDEAKTPVISAGEAAVNRSAGLKAQGDNSTIARNEKLQLNNSATARKKIEKVQGHHVHLKTHQSESRKVVASKPTYDPENPEFDLKTAEIREHMAKEAQESQERRPLVHDTEHLEKIGSVHWEEGQDPPDWHDLKTTDTKIGLACTIQKHCGEALICRNKMCSMCKSDRDCPSLATCEVTNKPGETFCIKHKEMAWEAAFTGKWEFICTLAIVVCSALAAAAGTGGGGMFVPLLMTLSLMKDTYVVALSQCMILGGSIINLACFVRLRHPERKDQPLIDYDCVVLFEPLLCLGVTLGVLVNRMAPSWLLLFLLTSTLGSLLIRVGTKGYKQLQQELLNPHPSPTVKVRSPEVSSSEDTEGQVSNEDTDDDTAGCNVGLLTALSQKASQLNGVIGLWVFMLLLSFHGLSPCSQQYVWLLTALTFVLVGFSIFAGQVLIGPERSKESPVQWVVSLTSDSKRSFENLQMTLQFPAVAFCAGFLGGLLGLGGGMILSPVLLEVGMHSEAVQATTAMFVFLSSSLGVIQFAVMGKVVWHYAFFYTGACIFGTMIGQYLCDVYVRKQKRYSLITIAVAGVLFSSLVCLLYVGVPLFIHDWNSGHNLWFSTVKLCASDAMLSNVPVSRVQIYNIDT